jgi:hypothetical protein
MDMGFGRQIKIEFNLIKVITPWMLNQDMVSTYGTMDGYTKGISKMIYEMVMVKCMRMRKRFITKDFGAKDRKLIRM